MQTEPRVQVQSNRKPTVLVYRRHLLSLSETFIKEQVLALRRWRAVLVGLRLLSEMPLDGLNTLILRPDDRTIFDRLIWKVNAWMGLLPHRTIERLQREGASLVHAHFGFDATEAWSIAEALNLPMLVTLHGNDINVNRDWWEAGCGGRSMTGYPDRLLTLAQQPQVRFVAVSDAIRQRAISYGIPKEKIFVRYIGVDPAKFVPGGRAIISRERRILFVGRLVEKKGCEFLIKALAQVQAQVPDASLVIIGEGILKNKLQRLASSLDLRVKFRGARSNSEVIQELQMARVLCLPSVRTANGDAEGFGMVLLEAQASGVPVVTSAAGGATEGIDNGITGFSFDERDIGTLSARLIYLLTDDAAAASMSVAGPRFVSERFDIRRCTARLESLYDIASS